MKKIACLLSVLAVLTASAAFADVLQWTGGIYEARITDPVVVGVAPGGGDLVAFDLIFENMSGDAGGNPFNIDLGDAATGRGITGNLHQQGVGLFNLFSPTLDDAQLADALDSHFNVFNADLLSLVNPVEDHDVAASAMPVGPAYGGMANYSFGTELKAMFNATGARPDGPLRTADWNVAHLVVPMADLLAGTTNVDGAISGSTLIEYFDFNIVVPEPATMSLLAVGGVAALIRRKK